MNKRIPPLELSNRIRAVYRADPAVAEAAIARCLEEQCEGLSASEKQTVLSEVIECFETSGCRTSAGGELESEVFSRVLRLIMGKRWTEADLPTVEILERVAGSLNTIFDTLNELVGVIRSTLSGKSAELETIRQVIGSDLEGDSESTSLKNYLDQIKEAFLIAHQAFQEAARSKVGEILTDLDPEHIASMARGGLKFGPLRKAELFEIYQDQYMKCKRWYESERFIEDLLREFEKRCQSLYR